jgi:predicted outer membrane repeat protein
VSGDKNNRFLMIVASTELITVTLDGLVVSNSKIESPPPPWLGPTGGGILAIADDGGLTLSLNAVTVAGNSADGGGGLSLISDGGRITARITSSLFKNNKARDLGGAIRIESEDARISLSVEDSRFENNKGSTGGAISMRVRGAGNPGGRIDIFRSVFLEGDTRPTGTGLCGVDIGADEF